MKASCCRNERQDRSDRRKAGRKGNEKKTLESSDHFLSEEQVVWIPVIPRSSVDLSQDPSTFSSTKEKGTEKPGSSQRDEVSHYKLVTG